MPVAQRRQECGRLLTYYETLTNPVAKAKALSRVREIFEKLKSEEVQRNIQNTADLGKVNLQTVRTMRGLVESLEDRITAQQHLLKESNEIAADQSGSKVGSMIDAALPSDPDNILEAKFSDDPEAVAIDEAMANAASSSAEHPTVSQKIDDWMQESADKRKRRQGKKGKRCITQLKPANT